MTGEAVSTVAALSALMSAVFGGGMFHKYIKSREEIAVTKYVLEQTQGSLEKVTNDVRELQFHRGRVDSKIEKIEEGIRKLDLLTDMSAKIATVEALVKSLADTVGLLLNRE